MQNPVSAPAFAGVNLVPAKAGIHCESRNPLSTVFEWSRPSTSLRHLMTATLAVTTALWQK